MRLKLGKGFAQRISIGLVDQMLSSGSNFAAGLVGARYLSSDEFGAYSVALLSYMVALGLTRGLVSEALLVRSGDTEADQNMRARAATGSAAWLGVGGGVCLAAASLVVDGSLSSCLLVTGIALPALMVQDTLRYAGFARAKPSTVLISDGFWTLGGLAAYVALLHWSHATAVTLLIAWALTGAIGGIMQAWADRIVPAMQRWLFWVTSNRDLSVRYALVYLSGQGAGQLATYSLAGVAGVVAVGAVRGAQTLFGPLSIVLAGIYVVLVPEGRRMVDRSTRRLTAMCTLASLLFVAVGAAMLGVLLWLSPDQGTAILGSTWASARAVFVPVGLAAIAGGALAGATAGLRALSAAKELLRIRLLTMPVAIVLPVIGAIIWKANGLAYGIAISVWANVFWYWRVYLRTAADFDRSRPVDVNA